MNEDKFTPGLWRDGNEAIKINIDRANPWSGTVFRVPEMSDARALVAVTFGASVEECVATARLISATPDLLTVARMVVEASDASGLTGPLGTAARAALSKATEGTDHGNR